MKYQQTRACVWEKVLVHLGAFQGQKDTHNCKNHWNIKIKGWISRSRGKERTACGIHRFGENVQKSAMARNLEVSEKKGSAENKTGTGTVHGPASWLFN